MIKVAAQLRGTIRGGLSLLRAAAVATARGSSNRRPARTRRPTFLLAAETLAPEFTGSAEASAADAAASDLSPALSQAPLRARARARATRPATRRPGGARRPAAKGGRGRGLAGGPHPPSCPEFTTAPSAQLSPADQRRRSRMAPAPAHPPRGGAVAAFIPFPSTHRLAVRSAAYIR